MEKLKSELKKEMRKEFADEISSLQRDRARAVAARAVTLVYETRSVMLHSLLRHRFPGFNLLSFDKQERLMAAVLTKGIHTRLDDVGFSFQMGSPDVQTLVSTLTDLGLKVDATGRVYGGQQVSAARHDQSHPLRALCDIDVSDRYSTLSAYITYVESALISGKDLFFTLRDWINIGMPPPSVARPNNRLQLSPTLSATLVSLEREKGMIHVMEEHNLLSDELLACY